MSNGHKRIYAVKLQSGYGIVKWISSLHLRRSFPKTDGEDQRDFNTAMVKVRIQVGWFFGDINFFFQICRFYEIIENRVGCSWPILIIMWTA